MSLALYRKYRPSVFADVIGQEHVTVPLSNALESGRHTTHIYLAVHVVAERLLAHESWRARLIA